MSRIGKLAIKIPAKVDIFIETNKITVKGPRGELIHSIPNDVHITQNELHIHVTSNFISTRSQQLHGTYRSLIYNMINGVVFGFEKKLELQGVGYRSQLNGKVLTMNVGYSHQIKLAVPEGIQLSVENNTFITIFGLDKALVGQVAANIRLVRPPEPYKGKGIRYQGEFVRKKIGKTGKK